MGCDIRTSKKYFPGQIQDTKKTGLLNNQPETFKNTHSLFNCTIKLPASTAGGFYIQLQQQKNKNILTITIQLLRLVSSSLVRLGTGLVRRLVGSRASTRHETHEHLPQQEMIYIVCSR